MKKGSGDNPGNICIGKKRNGTRVAVRKQEAMVTEGQEKEKGLVEVMPHGHDNSRGLWLQDRYALPK